MIDDPINPAAVLRHEEKQELMRIAAQNLLDHEAAGRRCDPEALRWARGIAGRIKPLGRPLSDGQPEPQRSTQNGKTQIRPR